MDDFEGDLSEWSGKQGQQHHGAIVADPLRPGNQVLTFTATNFGGDIFSPEVQVKPGETCHLYFEYLGLAPPGSEAKYFGGFAGYAENTDTEGGAFHRWLFGSSKGPGIDPSLQDDGQWREYAVTFDPFVNFDGSSVSLDNQTIRVTVEDYNYFWSAVRSATAISGDVYFDNIQLVCGQIELSLEASRLGKKKKSTYTPVTIYAPAWFDVRSIDIGSLTFHGANVASNGSLFWFSDFDKDGKEDLRVFFPSSEILAYSSGDTLELSGATLQGAPISGTVQVP